MRLNWFKQWGWLYVPASVPGVIFALAMLALCVRSSLPLIIVRIP